MGRQDRIYKTLSEALKTDKITLYNDSYKHSHHIAMKGVPDTNETHFRLEIVSPEFSGMSRVARHRLVYGLLKDEFDGGLHALQITSSKTPDEVS
ncbi:UV-induced protein uvi31 [Schizosaccharomyces pombe]